MALLRRSMSVSTPVLGDSTGYFRFGGDPVAWPQNICLGNEHRMNTRRRFPMVIPLEWSSYFNFSCEVRGQQRYILSKESNDFLASLLKIAGEKRINTLSRKTSLWRARLGGEPVPVGEDEYAVEAFSFQKMGSPPADKARGGRISCNGIPVLYVSSDQETAMSEIRPWPGQEISLARLVLLREVKVLDFSANYLDGTLNDLDRLWPLQHLNHEKPLTKEEHEEIAWCWINKAFATPVSDTSDSVDYVPTQIIAEAIKIAGYDGVSYQSSVTGGLNHAFFDLGCAEIEKPMLKYTQSVKYDFTSHQFR